MVPKKIHYVWLGGKPKNKLTEICINSWRRVLPDYEIIEWSESNLDIEKLCRKNKFFACCFKLKLWAFMSDYIRLMVLYNEGGIYLDTDVEVIKKFDNLLTKNVFMGYEYNGHIGTGTIGAEKNNELIARLLRFYDKEIWNADFVNNPTIFTYIKENEPAIFSQCELYPQNYFSPYIPGKNYTTAVETEDSYSVHWYTQNWNMSRRGYVFIYTKHIKNPVKRIISIVRKNLGYLRKRLVH